MLLIGPGLTLTNEGLVAEAGVACDGRSIAGVGAFAELKEKHPGAEILDAQGGLILPGFINAHTHLYTSLASGLHPGDPLPRNNREWYERSWWKLDKVLTPEDVLAAVRLGLVRSAKAGVTTLLDHHSSPACTQGILDSIAGCFEAVGLRGGLCVEVSDRNGESMARTAMAENLRFFFAAPKRKPNLVRGLFGLHASYALGPTSAQRCQAVRFVAGPNNATHLHLAEDEMDAEDAQTRYGLPGVVTRLLQENLLDEQAVAAHAVHLTDDELDALAALRARVVHLPRANAAMGVGRARVEDMLQRGMVVGLGTDGLNADMIGEMQAAAMGMRQAMGGVVTGVVEAWRLLFEGNPLIAASLLPEAPGALVTGSPADVIVLDYRSITPLNAANFILHLFDTVRASDVAHTVCAGEIIMRDRTLTRIDEAAVIAAARESAAKVWDRLAQPAA